MADQSKRPQEMMFNQEANAEKENLLKELFDFFCYNKKWWQAPIVLLLLLVSALVVLGGTVLAPFIYSIF